MLKMFQFLMKCCNFYLSCCPGLELFSFQKSNMKHGREGHHGALFLVLLFVSNNVKGTVSRDFEGGLNWASIDRSWEVRAPLIIRTFLTHVRRKPGKSRVSTLKNTFKICQSPSNFRCKIASVFSMWWVEFGGVPQHPEADFRWFFDRRVSENALYIGRALTS